MKHIEQATEKRLEVATKPGASRYLHTRGGPSGAPFITAPSTLRDLKLVKKRFGVVFFVDTQDAFAYAKGKGFKVVDRTERSGPSGENGPEFDDLSWEYEITDKSGRTVGLAFGDAGEGQAYIAPTAQHYQRWLKSQTQ